MTLYQPYHNLPRGYGGCMCMCHRVPNVFHCMPCCYPGKEDTIVPMCPGFDPPELNDEEKEDGEQK